jgi:hypothetical protein
MSIHPSPSFPLLPSDQADVIKIFLDLMQEHAHEDSVLLTPQDGSGDSFFPGDAFDYE